MRNLTTFTNRTRPVVAFILLAGLTIFSIPSVRAQESNAPAEVTAPQTSPQNSATNDAEIQRNLKERIMGIVAEQSDPRPDSEKRIKAYVGQVDKVTAESIFLKTNRTQEAIRMSPQRTTILDLAKQTPLQFQEIDLGSWAIVMGVMTDEDVLEARRVLISTTSLLPKPRTILFGTIQKINSLSVTLTRPNQEPLTLKLNRSTRFADKEGNKISVTKIKPDMRIVLAINKDQEATGAATLVRLTQELPAEQ